MIRDAGYRFSRAPAAAAIALIAWTAQRAEAQELVYAFGRRRAKLDPEKL